MIFNQHPRISYMKILSILSDRIRILIALISIYAKSIKFGFSYIVKLAV